MFFGSHLSPKSEHRLFLEAMYLQKANIDFFWKSLISPEQSTHVFWKSILSKKRRFDLFRMLEISSNQMMMFFESHLSRLDNLRLLDNTMRLNGLTLREEWVGWCFGGFVVR